MSEALATHIDQFLDHLTTYRHMAANTVAAYQNDLRQFEAYVSSSVRAGHPGGNGHPPEPVDAAAIAGFVLDMRERGYAEATVARKVAAVRSFFHFAAEAGIVAHNPAAQVDTPRVRRSMPQAASPHDVQALIELGCSGEMASDLRDRAMLTLLYHSGMRVSELVALDRDDLDMDAGLVRCRGRAGRLRSIPLSEPVRILLRDYLLGARPLLLRAGGGHEPALFPNRRGSRLTRQGFWLIMKECAHRAGIHGTLTPHSLRHSFALQHLEGGSTLRDLKELLGHVNISTTQIYVAASRTHRPAADRGTARAPA